MEATEELEAMKEDAVAQHHLLVTSDNWRVATETSSLMPSLVLSWGPGTLESRAGFEATSHAEGLICHKSLCCIRPVL